MADSTLDQVMAQSAASPPSIHPPNMTPAFAGTNASSQASQSAAPAPIATFTSSSSAAGTTSATSAAATTNETLAKESTRNGFEIAAPDSTAEARTKLPAPTTSASTSSTASPSAASAALRIVLAASAASSNPNSSPNEGTPTLATEVLPAPPRLPSDASYAPLAPDVRPEGGLLTLQPGITAAALAAHRKKAQAAPPAVMMSLHADGTNRKGPVMPTALKEVLMGQPVGGEKAAAARAASKKSAESKPTTSRKGRHSAPIRPSALVLAQASSSKSHANDVALKIPDLAGSLPVTAAASPSLPLLSLPEPESSEDGGRSRAQSLGGPPDLTLDAASDISLSMRSDSTVPLPEGEAEEEAVTTWNSDAPMSEGAALEEREDGETRKKGNDEDVEMSLETENQTALTAVDVITSPAHAPPPASERESVDVDAVMSQASGLVASTSEPSLLHSPHADTASGQVNGSAGATLDTLMSDASAAVATSTQVATPVKRGRGRPKKLTVAPSVVAGPPSSGLTTGVASPLLSAITLPPLTPVTPSEDGRAAGRPRRSAAPTGSMDLKQRRKPRASPSLGGHQGSSTPVREREPQAEHNAHLTPNTKLMIPLTDTASAEAVDEAKAFVVPSPVKKKEANNARTPMPLLSSAGATTPSAQSKNAEDEQSTLVTKSGGPEKTEALVNNEHCDTCFGSGHLLCCEGCVRSFHFQCLNPPLDIDEMPKPETPVSSNTPLPTPLATNFKSDASTSAAKADEPAWYCHVCKASKNKKRKPPKGLFGPLLHQLEAENPSNYALPAEIRNYFKGVATDSNGDYINAAALRPLKVNKAGFLDERDPFKLKDKNGKAALCYKCGESSLPKSSSAVSSWTALTPPPSVAASIGDSGAALCATPTRVYTAALDVSLDIDLSQTREKERKEDEGWRKIVSCDYCALHWHIDCLDPPLIGMPHATRKWMCPNHVEHVQKPQRVPKSGAAAPQSIDLPLPTSATIGRGKHYRSRVRNDGHIDIIPDPLDTLFDGGAGTGKSLSKGWEEQDIPGASMGGVASKLRYRIPEKVIRLDFWSRITSDENNARLQMEMPSSSNSGLDMLASIASHRLGTTHVAPARQLVKTVLMPEPTPPSDVPIPLSSIRTSAKRRASSSSLSSTLSSSAAIVKDEASSFGSAGAGRLEVRVTKPLAKRFRVAPSIATTTTDGGDAMEQDDSGNESPLTDIDEDSTPFGSSIGKAAATFKSSHSEIREAEAVRLRAVKQLMERAGEERLLRFLESASLDD